MRFTSFMVGNKPGERLTKSSTLDPLQDDPKVVVVMLGAVEQRPNLLLGFKLAKKNNQIGEAVMVRSPGYFDKNYYRQFWMG